MLSQIKIDIDPGIFADMTTGQGPYMTAAAFIALLQITVIPRFSERRIRSGLLLATVCFQMLALGVGLFKGG